MTKLPTTQTIHLKLPTPYPAQRDAIWCPERYAIIEASTKAGKTLGCLVWLEHLALTATQPGQYWWVAPVYQQARIAYRRLVRMLPKIAMAKPPSESMLEIHLVNGAIIQFKSAEKPDNLYGDDVRAAVFDEATRAREEAWHALRSTLTATKGPLRIIGNVKGNRNWVYALARAAEAGRPGWRYTKITAYDAVRAGILDAAEIEDARSVLPDDVFRELYLCEPTQHGSNPFGDYQGAIAPAMSTLPPVVWGFDLARKVDWTVGVGLDRNGHVCRIERWRESWGATAERVAEMTRGRIGYFDATGVGDVVGDMLATRGCTLEGIVWTETTRQNMLEGLATAIQTRRTMFPEGVIADELSEFAYEVSGRNLRYRSHGAHDDAVCAYAMAWAAGVRSYAWALKPATAPTQSAPPPRSMAATNRPKTASAARARARI